MPKFELDADGLSGADSGTESLGRKQSTIPDNFIPSTDLDNNKTDNVKDANETTKFRKRRSLQQQLLNNRQYKYREYKRKMEKQNSSFKMKEDTSEFYGALEAKRKAKKLREQLTYERELELFRQERVQLLNKESKNSTEEKEEDIHDKDDSESEKELATNSKLVPLTKQALVQYSDSDSE